MVSVTQQFKTTSSMGRLTLNVLLSFAQFECSRSEWLAVRATLGGKEKNPVLRLAFCSHKSVHCHWCGCRRNEPGQLG